MLLSGNSISNVIREHSESGFIVGTGQPRTAVSDALKIAMAAWGKHH